MQQSHTNGYFCERNRRRQYSLQQQAHRHLLQQQL